MPPHLRIKIGGVAVPWPVEAQTEVNNTRTAGTWSAGIAFLDRDPMNLAWWATQSTLRVEIDASLNGQNFTTLMVGNADEVEITPNTNYVTLTGRDLTALLIDQKTAQTYQNQTASEVATILANGVGLTPMVTPTTVPVGLYYASNHTRMSMGDLARAVTSWDLLNFLADQENFDVFVSGTSLYFQPKQQAGGIPFQVNWSKVGGVVVSNVMNLQMKRSLTIAHDLSVEVQSWNTALNREVTVKASSTANGTSATGPAQNYTFTKPNLTPAQAADYANQQLLALSRAV